MIYKLIVKLFAKNSLIVWAVVAVLYLTQINLLWLRGCGMIRCTWVTTFLPTIAFFGHVVAAMIDSIVGDISNNNGFKIIESSLNIITFIVFPIVMVVLHELGIL